MTIASITAQGDGVNCIAVYSMIMRFAVTAREERSESMDIILAIFSVIGLIFLFSFGFFLGYREGMATMKRIDDNIIEEAKRCIYGEE